jgi:hypothetical protein
VIYDSIILKYTSGGKKFSKKLALSGMGYYNIQNIKNCTGFCNCRYLQPGAVEIPKNEH